MSDRTMPERVRCLDCGFVGRGALVTDDPAYQGAYTACGNFECGSLATIEMDGPEGTDVPAEEPAQ